MDNKIFALFVYFISIENYCLVEKQNIENFVKKMEDSEFKIGCWHVMNCTSPRIVFKKINITQWIGNYSYECKICFCLKSKVRDNKIWILTDMFQPWNCVGLKLWFSLNGTNLRTSFSPSSSCSLDTLFKLQDILWNTFFFWSNIILSPA